MSIDTGSGPQRVDRDDEIDFLSLHRHDPEFFPFILSSGHGADPRTAQCDILFAAPGQTKAATAGEDFLGELDGLSARRTAQPHSAVPFQGGWFVYLAYELAGSVEPRLNPPTDAAQHIALATRCDGALVRLRPGGDLYAVGSIDAQSGILARLQAHGAGEANPEPPGKITARVAEEDEEEFLSRVRRVKDYITAGDIYQLNLSRRWHLDIDHPVSAADLFDALRHHNAAPFATLASWPGLEIISSSPERLFQVRGRHIATRPIAGTRPRGDDDRAELEGLVGHPKERAEHIMLIDLERNDLGRICRTGSVEVDELLGVESYPTVHHIVSNVRGELREGVGAGEIVRAVFPGGTITGCPKVRCMEIIAELEARPRGPYTGSIGYISDCGAMDFNILIRTLVREQGRARVDAGAGIVADSDPARELQETRVKAAGLLRAFELR